ncbi:MAG: Carbon monoxide oxidation accessory protein CoxD, partial [uncultured Blastococcus sp.]
ERAHRHAHRRQGAVGPGAVGPAVLRRSGADVGRPRGHRLPARRGAGHRRLPGAGDAPPPVPGGGGRRRQDRPGPRARPDHRAAHLPAPVLRGPGGQPGALRLGLRPSAAAPARRRGRPRHRRHRDARGVPLRPALPARPAAAAGARGLAERAAGRRGGPGRRRVRGLPAGGPVRLHHLHPGAGHRPGHDAAAGGPHLQPHPGGARRPQAPLPLPLAAAPGVRPGGGDPAQPAAAGDRDAGPRGRPRDGEAADARPAQAARHRRVDGLGDRAAHPGGARPRSRPGSAHAGRRAQVPRGHRARAGPGPGGAVRWL